MTQIIPEALPVRVDVTPAVSVQVVGPHGLVATLTLPDSDEAWGIAPEFVGALSSAMGEALARQMIDDAAAEPEAIGVLELTDDFMDRMEAQDG